MTQSPWFACSASTISFFTACFLYSSGFLQHHFQFNFCLHIMFILHSAFIKSLTISLAGCGVFLFVGLGFFVCFGVCGLFWHRLISLPLTLLWLLRLFIICYTISWHLCNLFFSLSHCPKTVVYNCSSAKSPTRTPNTAKFWGVWGCLLGSMCLFWWWDLFIPLWLTYSFTTTKSVASPEHTLIITKSMTCIEKSDF